MPDQDIIVSTTQDHLEIETIVNDVVVMKGGALSLILQVSAINFGLLSEEEQDATIYTYAGLLNSLSFPIEIVIKSEKKDISGYLESLNSQEQKLKTPVLKDRMRKYRQFIEETIVEQNVLDKKFYIVIPYQQISLSSNTKISQDLINKARMDLEPKRDHLIKQLARIGLVSQQLNSQSLLKLFHTLYNPESKGQKFSLPKDYEKPIVAPNIKTDSTQTTPQQPQPTSSQPAQ